MADDAGNEQREILAAAGSSHHEQLTPARPIDLEIPISIRVDQPDWNIERMRTAVAAMLTQVGIRSALRSSPPGQFYPKLSLGLSDFIGFGWSPSTQSRSGDCWSVLWRSTSAVAAVAAAK